MQKTFHSRVIVQCVPEATPYTLPGAVATVAPILCDPAESAILTLTLYLY